MSGVRSSASEDRQRRRHRRHEQLRRPRRRQQPERAAGERQHQALHQQLAHDARSRAADGETDRDLLLPRRSERQHHVGEIEARRQQHRRRESLQHRDRHPDLRVVLRAGADAEAAERPDDQILVLVVVGIGLFVRGGNDLELRVRLIARHAGLQPADHDQRPAAAIRDRKTPIGVEVALDRIVHAERHEILGAHDRGGAGEVLRGHADNGEVLAVDADGLLEDVAIESRSLPELVADDHRARRGARAFLVDREVAAVDRPHAERLEVAGRDDVDHRLAGGVVLGDAGERDVVRGEVRERSARVAHVDKAGIGEGAIAALGRAVLAEHADDFTRRVSAGERPDHQAVDDAEDAGVDADAERQHADGGQREAGMLEEKASAVAKVLPEGPHSRHRRAFATKCFGRIFFSIGQLTVRSRLDFTQFVIARDRDRARRGRGQGVQYRCHFTHIRCSTLTAVLHSDGDFTYSANIRVEFSVPAPMSGLYKCQASFSVDGAGLPSREEQKTIYIIPTVVYCRS